MSDDDTDDVDEATLSESRYSPRSDAGSDDDGEFRKPIARRRRKGLTRDEWKGILLWLCIVVGGSKLSHILLVHIMNGFCIALNLPCKPEGY